MAKLSKEEIVTIQVLSDHGDSGRAIARRLKVTEGSVRYHLRRRASGAEDGRRRKTMLVEQAGLAEAARHWWHRRQQELSEDRPPSVEALHRFLVEEHGFRGSYKSVRKFARREFPAPKLRPFRRIETPPGAQAQVDWFGPRMVDLGGEAREPLFGFLMVLSHSRMAALLWSRSTDQLAWHHGHLESFRRLGGVPAVARIDNLRTGVAHGAGPWSEINASYRSFARTLGFHVDPHEAYCPRSKGKVERLVRIAERIGPGDLRFDSLEHLQEWTDARMLASAARRRCAATGLSVLDSWHAERRLLRALPETVGIIFDLSVRRPVHLDCTVRFEGRSYSVPFAHCGRSVEVRGCSGFVLIIDPGSGATLARHPRGTAARLVVDPAHFEGAPTDRVAAPKPLGRLSRRLQELASSPVERRSVDYYAALAEVAR